MRKRHLQPRRGRSCVQELPGGDVRRELGAGVWVRLRALSGRDLKLGSWGQLLSDLPAVCAGHRRPQSVQRRMPGLRRGDFSKCERSGRVRALPGEPLLGEPGGPDLHRMPGWDSVPSWVFDERCVRGPRRIVQLHWAVYDAAG